MKNFGKLSKKQITDKTGKRTTVWVAMDGIHPAAKKPVVGNLTEKEKRIIEAHRLTDENIAKRQAEYDKAQGERQKYIQENGYPMGNDAAFDKLVRAKVEAEDILNRAKTAKENLLPLPTSHHPAAKLPKSGNEYETLVKKIGVSQKIDGENRHEVTTTKEIAAILGITTPQAFEVMTKIEKKGNAFRYGYRTKTGWEEADHSGLKTHSLGWQLSSKPVEKEFDYTKLFNLKSEPAKNTEEADREAAYQKTTFDKKWAATYKEAKAKLIEQYQTAKVKHKEWSEKQYQPNKGTVVVGGKYDEYGSSKNIGAINEAKKQRQIKAAKEDMDTAIKDLKEIGLTGSEIEKIKSNG